MDQYALQSGTPRQKAKIGEYEFLRIMNETELQATLLALLPIIKVEEGNPKDKCKYMIGTQTGQLLIRAKQIMIRVGGGYATLPDHIK